MENNDYEGAHFKYDSFTNIIDIFIKKTNSYKFKKYKFWFER